jgi:hypothetical protein
MNKYEQLIEHIINEDEQAAKELFHQLVVEKSRDIYESLMDEDLGGNASQNFVSDITDQNDSAQEQGLGEDDEEMDLDSEDEFGTDDDMADMDGEEETFGDDGEMDDMGSEEAEHGEIESKIDDLSAQLEELKGMLAGEDHGMDDMAGDEGEMGGESDFDMDGAEGEMEGMNMESANPFAKSGSASGKSGSASGSGKSGSGMKEAKKMSGSGMSGSGKSGSGIKEAAKASGSGVSGSGKSGSGKSGSGKMESYKKTDVEIMKEYVDKIGEIYKLNTPNSETGKTVGTGGDEPTINKKQVSLDKGPDFGGTNENILNGQGNEEAADGKQFKAPNNEYSKKRGDLPHAGQFKNVPGNKKVWDKNEGKVGADQKQTEQGKTVGTGGDKPSLNTKGIEGGAGQPTGKKK